MKGEEREGGGGKWRGDLHTVGASDLHFVSVSWHHDRRDDDDDVDDDDGAALKANGALIDPDAVVVGPLRNISLCDIDFRVTARKCW